MTQLNGKAFLTAAALLSLVGTQGCKTVARENIISSVETGIGVTLAENPKTEMYEAKVGYIRSQFYSVPTGKVVENQEAGKTGKHCLMNNDVRTNRADITPELVSGIRMESDARHLFLGLSVAENFAVGKVAVMSPAAVAMYVAAADSRTANAAALAAESVAQAGKSTAAMPVAVTPEIGELYRRISELRRADANNRVKALEFVKRPENGGFASWDDFVKSNPSKEKLESLLGELQ